MKKNPHRRWVTADPVCSATSSSSASVAPSPSISPAPRRWYVVGFDTTRDDWRLFRVDRIGELTVGDRVTPPRAGPGDGDLTAWLRSDFGRTPTRTPPAAR